MVDYRCGREGLCLFLCLTSFLLAQTLWSTMNPIIIKSAQQLEASEWFVIALKDLNTAVRMTDVCRKLHQYQQKGIIKFDGELHYTWHYDMRWTKTDLKKRGIIKIKFRKGNKTYWGLV